MIPNKSKRDDIISDCKEIKILIVDNILSSFFHSFIHAFIYNWFVNSTEKTDFPMSKKIRLRGRSEVPSFARGILKYVYPSLDVILM